MTIFEIAPNRPNMSEAEWASRVECAAGHHLMERYGLTDFVEGLVGVRIADEPDTFLLKGYNEFFDEVRASTLYKVRFDDTPDVGAGRPLNYASCNQIKHILQARPDVNCIIHTHTNATAVVASLKGGLQPMTQHAFIVARHVGYMDFDVEIDDACMEATVKALGDKNILLMRNHGLMTVGTCVAEAFFLTRTLDVACRAQIDAMQTGAEILLPHVDQEITDQMIHDYATHKDHVPVFDGSLQWDGLIRRLDRENLDYKT